MGDREALPPHGSRIANRLVRKSRPIVALSGERHGVWVLHHPGGELASRLAYASGKLEGAAERRFPDGQVEWRGDYSAGRRTGAWSFYHPGGRKASEGTYADGQRVGAWTFWDEDGAVDEQRSGTYLAGERTGE